MMDDLERLMEDPMRNHEKIMQRLQPILPTIVHKEYTGRQPALVDDNNGNGNEPPLFSDEQIDVVAAAMAELRIAMRDEFATMIENTMGSLTEQVATLQGQMSVMMNLINTIVSNGNNKGNDTKSIEASEVKTTRRVRVRRTNETA